VTKEAGWWSRRLRLAVAGYAVLGTVLTMVVALVFLNVPALQQGFEQAGFDPVRARAAAEGTRVTGALANVVLCALYLAVGVAAVRNGSRWAFWTGLVLYGITGAGVVIVPLRDTGLSWAGLSLTLLNDGLALALFGWMLVALIRHRRRSGGDG
jgi:hypothetical protein